MSLRPASSRSQLKWKQFVQKDDGSWFLNLPPYYADLFQTYFPALVKESNTGFRNSSSGKTKYAFFPKLDERAVQRVERFVKFFEQAVCLGVNPYLKKDFSEELDFCMALDFNRPGPQERRTTIGEWEYKAKYHQNKLALTRLAAEMTVVVRSFTRILVPRPRLLTYVPADPGKDFYLPRELAKLILAGVPEEFWGEPKPLVTAKLMATKQSAKNMTVDQKIAQWQRIIESKGIQLSRSVTDCAVLIVDDLYQSGASLWSFAKYVKSLGAAKVVGVACVKSLRDSDNQ